MTPYLFAFLRPVITILHFEPVGGRGWSSPWGSLRSKHPSTPVILWIRCAQGEDCVLSVHSLSVSLFLFILTFKYPVSLQSSFKKILHSE